MVNKLIIPQTEEVAYLNNITPSYEEFMKTYQVDEKVKASYESEINSYGDLGVEKGYGPCYVCDQSEQWTYLKVGCPAIGCPKKDSPASYWYHWCGGRAQISNKAFIKCENCYSANYHMSKWNFECESHTSGTDNSVNYRSFHKCLASLIYSDDYNQIIADVTSYMVCKRSEWPN
jgi:hypothetical protein